MLLGSLRRSSSAAAIAATSACSRQLFCLPSHRRAAFRYSAYNAGARSSDSQLRRCASTSPTPSSAAVANGGGDASSSTAGPASDEGTAKEELPKLTPAQLARAASPSTGDGGQKLSKLQRGGLGTVGAALTAAGVGGAAWLHWPLLGPSGLCAIAGAGGVALSALAARGELPGHKAKEKGEKSKPVLDLKLLNDELRFKAELAQLKTLASPTSKEPFPKEVQAALAAADKAAEKASKEAAAQRQKELVEDVKQALAAGSSADAVRRRLRPRLFVFDFRPDGDGGAMSQRPGATKSQIELLTSSVTFIISAASKHDEVLVRLTSPGGAVAPYGLAAAQLQRLRDANVRLTVCVDTVAASGGYMMACVADRVVAAPFAMLGSIGVIAGVPNISKVLERNDVDFLQVTGGKYKRTVNILTANTEEGVAKFRQDIDDIHTAFKDHVQKWRPDLDIEQTATGEVWLGAAALERGLVDGVGTSDEQITSKIKEGFDAIELTQAKKQKAGIAKLLEGIGGGAAGFAETAVLHASEAANAIWQRLLHGQTAANARVEAPHLQNDR